MFIIINLRTRMEYSTIFYLTSTTNTFEDVMKVLEKKIGSNWRLRITFYRYMLIDKPFLIKHQLSRFIEVRMHEKKIKNHFPLEFYLHYGKIDFEVVVETGDGICNVNKKENKENFFRLTDKDPLRFKISDVKKELEKKFGNLTSGYFENRYCNPNMSLAECGIEHGGVIYFKMSSI